MQIPMQAWHCVMWWDWYDLMKSHPCTKCRFEVTHLLGENLQDIYIYIYTNRKFGKCRIPECSFNLPTSYVLLWRRRPYEGSCKTRRFCGVQQGVIMRGTLCHFEPFHNARNVLLCDIGAIISYNSLASFQNMTPSSWHLQHFGPVHLHFAWQAQHFRRVVLRFFSISGFRRVVTECKSRCRRGTLWECHFDWQVWLLVQIRRVWNVVLRVRPGRRQARRSTIYTSNSTLFSTLCTLHFPLPILHLTYLYTLHSYKLYALHFTRHKPHSTLHKEKICRRYRHYTLHFTRNTSHIFRCTRHSALYTLHLTLHTFYAFHTSLILFI